MSYIARTLPKTLLAERGKLGSGYACPIAIFCQIHWQLVTGQVVMLHADVFFIDTLSRLIGLVNKEESAGGQHMDTK